MKNKLFRPLNHQKIPIRSKDMLLTYAFLQIEQAIFWKNKNGHCTAHSEQIELKFENKPCPGSTKP